MKIRNGRLIGAPIEGRYDLKQLDADGLMTLDRILAKQRNGNRLTADELGKLMKLRQAARAEGQPPVAAHTNPYAQISAAVAELREMFKS